MGSFFVATAVLRGLNFIWLAIILGLSAALIESQSRANAQVNFAIFVGVFGIIFSSFYGFVALFVEALAWPIIVFTIEFLNFVFAFAGGTALSVATRTHSCTNQAYINSNRITQGSTKRCRESQALEAFLYFSVFTSIGLLIVYGLQMARQGLGLPSRRIAAPRTGVPTMSQV